MLEGLAKLKTLKQLSALKNEKSNQKGGGKRIGNISLEIT